MSAIEAYSGAVALRPDSMLPRLRRGEAYQRLEAGPDGIHRSEVFPGLWLDSAALLRGDMPGVLSVVQQGLASSEHAAFVRRLQAPPAQS